MNLLSIIATCIDISMKNENNILKILLMDYSKKKFSKKQMFLLYIKIATIKTNTPFYIFMHEWIVNHANEIISHFLRDN